MASVVASAAPAQMTQLSTAIGTGADALSVKISWTAPADNSAPITAYQVQIRHRDGVEYTEDLIDCDGADPGVLAASSCLVPLVTLRSTFGLIYGDLVVARARAINGIGAG